MRGRSASAARAEERAVDAETVEELQRRVRESGVRRRQIKSRLRVRILVGALVGKEEKGLLTLDRTAKRTSGVEPLERRFLDVRILEWAAFPEVFVAIVGEQPPVIGIRPRTGDRVDHPAG